MPIDWLVVLWHMHVKPMSKSGYGSQLCLKLKAKWHIYGNIGWRRTVNEEAGNESNDVGIERQAVERCYTPVSGSTVFWKN